MKNFLSVTVLVFLLPMMGMGQSFQWAKQVGGSGNDYSTLSETDLNGNIIICGSYNDIVDFDPGPSIYNLGFSGGPVNYYVLKLDSVGNFLWARDFGLIPATIYLMDMTIDLNNNILFTGSFIGAGSDFDWGAGSTLLSIGTSLRCGFIMKIDPNGNLIWAKQDQGSGGSFSNPNAIATANNGDIIITGGFRHGVDFDPGVGTFIMINNSNNNWDDIFISRLDSNGNFLWAKSSGGNHNEFAGFTELDNFGNILISGTFSDTSDLDPGPGVFNLISTNVGSVFLEKLDAGGNFLWADKLTCSSGLQLPVCINSDVSGAAYFIGYFPDTLDIDPGLATQNVVSSGLNDFYILKIDINGNLIWGRTIGGIGEDIANDLKLDANSNLYLVGNFNNTVDFDPGAATYNLNSNGIDDPFILKLDANGNFLWVKQLGGTGNDRGYGIAVDVSGSVYATGKFSGTADMNPDAGVNNFTSNGSGDMYVVKLGAPIVCNATSSNINVTSCSSYTSPSGNYTWSSSGTYNDTIPNAAGCDSVITINLTINTLDIGFSLYPDPDTTQMHHWFAVDTVTGTPPYTYLWGWGDGNTSTGATPSHTYSAAAFYAICLSVTDGAGCTTTYCDSSTYISKTEEERLIITINVVTQLPNGITTVTPQQNNLNIIPNPCSTCEITGVENPNDLTVTDIIGRKLTATFTKSANGYNINLPETTTGLFIIRNTKTGEVVKFVRE